MSTASSLLIPRQRLNVYWVITLFLDEWDVPTIHAYTTVGAGIVSGDNIVEKRGDQRKRHLATKEGDKSVTNPPGLSPDSPLRLPNDTGVESFLRA